MRDLEKKLNYTFRNQALLEEALNHSSYANEHRAGGLRSNERLEFLGDSVLGFVTAEFLFCQLNIVSDSISARASPCPTIRRKKFRV